MAQAIVTYGDILSSILEKLGVQSSDTLATNKIKRMINEIYLDEIVPFKPWMWLQKSTQVVHKAPVATGTVHVTNGSATATLSTAPTGLGSFKDWMFSVQDSNVVYPIEAHTADSTTITFNVPFQETTNATANFQIWRDRIDLPTNAKETVDIWHSQWPKPLEGVGPQGFRALGARDPKLEDFPKYYNTYDFHDPSTDGDDETESARYRQTRIYPSITQQNVVLNVDFIEKATALDSLTDEPLMPIGDRVSLFYGALSLAYSAINRNEEMSDKMWMKFQAKLGRMAGEREEGQDTPHLRPNPRYVNSIRNGGLRRGAKRRFW